MLDLGGMRSARGGALAMGLAAALGAGAAGCYTDGGSTGERPIRETAKMQVFLCTGGSPGSPTCPQHRMPLDGAGAPGAVLEFVAQAIGNGFFLGGLSITSGPLGLSAERATLRFWDIGLVQERTLDEPLDIPPRGVSFLANVLTSEPARQLSLRLEAPGPHQP